MSNRGVVSILWVLVTLDNLASGKASFRPTCLIKKRQNWIKYSILREHMQSPRRQALAACVADLDRLPPVCSRYSVGKTCDGTANFEYRLDSGYRTIQTAYAKPGTLGGSTSVGIPAFQGPHNPHRPEIGIRIAARYSIVVEEIHTSRILYLGDIVYSQEKYAVYHV